MLLVFFRLGVVFAFFGASFDAFFDGIGEELAWVEDLLSPHVH